MPIHFLSWSVDFPERRDRAPCTPGQPSRRRRHSWPETRHIQCDAPPRNRTENVPLACALLPPKPRWRPLPEESGQSASADPIKRLLPASESAHLDAAQQSLQKLFEGSYLVEEPNWLLVRANRCVGFVNLIQMLRTPEQKPPATAAVIKQAGPLPARSPAPLFLQERAWLRGTQASGRTPTILADDEKSSLLVMSRVSGLHLKRSQFEHEVMDWVVDSIALLHTTPLTAEMIEIRGEQRFPWSLDRWIPYVTDTKRRMSEHRAAQLTKLKNHIVTALDRFPAVRTAVHGDLIAGNILVDCTLRRAHLIDFEFSSRGDPMFDLAFFAVGLHLNFFRAIELLPRYERAIKAHGGSTDVSNEPRLALYVTYQRLFRHVASHKEYQPFLQNSGDDYERWLYLLHEDVEQLQQRELLPYFSIEPRGRTLG